MRIDSGNIGMESARSYASSTRNVIRQKDSFVNLRQQFTAVAGTSKVSDTDRLKMLDKIRQECIRYLIQLFYPSGRQNDEYQTDNVITGETETAYFGSGMTVMQGEFSTTYMEQENTSFQTQGMVRIADGREISFGLELTMSRSFMETTQFSYEAAYQNAQFCDPLVINLDNEIAEVSDQKFQFDIDGDGILDSVSMLNPGSGYLALDKNGDGVINDGKELFGTGSGDGFKDLSDYDSDGNGWIDENDEIWDKLLIWTKDENGRDKLYHLTEKGVGAICLRNQPTEFALNSLRTNRTNAVIRSTGIFLYENGMAGTVQHLDLAK